MSATLENGFYVAVVHGKRTICRRKTDELSLISGRGTYGTIFRHPVPPSRRRMSGRPCGARRDGDDCGLAGTSRTVRVRRVLRLVGGLSLGGNSQCAVGGQVEKWRAEAAHAFAGRSRFAALPNWPLHCANSAHHAGQRQRLQGIRATSDRPDDDMLSRDMAVQDGMAFASALMSVLSLTPTFQSWC